MRAVSVESRGTRADGMEIVQAMLVSDTTPDTLPTTGADVVGMNEHQIFAPLSMLYIIADTDPKIYITNESGVFTPQ